MSLGLPIGQVLLLGLGGALVFMNVLLAAFNILPLGPLDGAGVLRGMLPDHWLRVTTACATTPTPCPSSSCS